MKLDRAKQSRLTLADVAAKAAVSQMTVSRALGGRPGVSPDTRRRIVRAARELGYRRHALASGLASRTADMLGVLLAGREMTENPCAMEVVAAFENAAYNTGKSVLIQPVWSQETCEKRLNVLLEMRVEGVVLSAPLQPRLQRALVDSGVKVVDFAGPPKAPGVSAVIVDYAPAAHALLSYLKGLGHRQVDLIVPADDQPDFGRGVGPTYLALVQNLGMCCGRIETGDWSAVGGMRAMRRLLDGGCAPTAVVAANDLMAMGALHICHGQGLRIPQDVSVVGMDDISYASICCPPLTTLALPKRAMGGEMLRLLLDENSHLGRTVSFAQELVVRGSTGPAREERSGSAGSRERATMGAPGKEVS